MIESPSRDYCAILLCAGVGSRLTPLTDDRPKCLVPIGDTTMLALSLAALEASGVVGRVVIVTGYRAEMVRDAAKSARMPVTFAHADRYESTQNVVSLATGLRERRPREPWMKLDGDLIVDPAIIAALAGPGARVAVDTSVRVGAEEMKVLVDRGRITCFGKGLAPKRCAGESIGVEAFAGMAADRVAAAIHSAVERGRCDVYYEDVYNDVLSDVAFAPLAVDSTSWIEVDDHDDLARAAALIANDPRFGGGRR